MTKYNLWDVIYNGELLDVNAETRQGAIDWAEDHFMNSYECDDMRNGDIREKECIIKGYVFDDYTGEEEEVCFESVTLSYEHYHGDHIEHNTNYGLSTPLGFRDVSRTTS